MYRMYRKRNRMPSGNDNDDGFVSSLKKSLGKNLGARIAGLGGNLLGTFKKGGKVKKTGVYKLHAGETVVPANESPDQFRKRKLGHRY